MHNIFFLINTCWIFISEFIQYTMFNNYDKFIGNIMHRLVSINVLYVKVFQAFALNNSIIDKKLNAELMKYTDNAPWTNNDIAWETILELENKYDLDFGDYIPINAGMVSIVFKSINKTTNENIIVKMQRKNIHMDLEQAIQQLLFMVYMFSFIPVLKCLNLEEIIKKNTSLLYLQLDFKTEVSNMQTMKLNCKHLTYVKIPRVYDNITDNYPNVIMMEYIEGDKIMDIDPEDSIHYAKLCVKFGFTTLLIHGVSHADLHIGNILFIKNPNLNNKYQIGILDFGIVYNIHSDLRNKLLEIFVDLFQEDIKNTAYRFLYCGLLEPIENIEKIPKIHKENIINIISNFFIKGKDMNNKNKIQVNIYKSILELKKYLDENELSVCGIYPSDSFVQMQLALAMNDGLVSTFNKYDNYIDIIDSVITEMFHLDILLED